MTRTPAVLAATVLCLCTGIPARAQASSGEPRLRELYKELVEATPSADLSGGILGR